MFSRYIARHAIPLVRRHYTTGEKLVDVCVHETSGIATVTMQRLPVNGLNLDMLTALSKAFDEVEGNKPKGMILTSSSKSVFSAGLDFQELYKPDPDRLRTFWSALQDVCIKFYGSSFPTVAVINGHALAGGCLLANCCEYRVMVRNFNIGFNEIKLGIIVPNWIMTNCKQIISDRQAELAFTSGKLFTTDEALELGLVDDIARDKAEGLVKADEFFKRFDKVNHLARSMTKNAIRSKYLEYLIKHRKEDVDAFVIMLNQPHIQKNIEEYIQALKKK